MTCIIKITFARLILLFIGLISLATHSFGQEQDIHQIEFKFQHSLRIPHNSVLIKMARLSDGTTVNVTSNPMNIESERWIETKLDDSFELPNSEFDEVVEAIQSIEYTDIKSNQDYVGKDGTTCEILFENNGTITSYKIWSPNYNTKERNLKAYLDACKLILKKAKLKPKKIL